jgi:hypothetical protein
MNLHFLAGRSGFQDVGTRAEFLKPQTTAQLAGFTATALCSIQSTTIRKTRYEKFKLSFYRFGYVLFYSLRLSFCHVYLGTSQK